MCSSTKKTRNGISENDCYDAVNENEQYINILIANH